MLFRIIDLLKKGSYYLFLAIGFLFELGIKGILGLLFLIYIASYILAELWDSLLIMSAVGVGAFFLIRHLYKKYTVSKEKYVEELIEKLFAKTIDKYKDQFKLNTGDPNLIIDGSYKIPTAEKMPLEKQYNYYDRKIMELDVIRDNVLNMKKGFGIMTNSEQFFFNRMQNVLREKGIPAELIKDNYSIVRDYQSYYLGVREHYEKNMKIVESGVKGEDRMDKELMSFSRNNEFYYLKNIMLKYGEKSFETDFLVISKHGIFSLEVKNIGSNGNLMIRITPDGQWLKVLSKGNVLPMQDVSSQVNYHISMTEGLLRNYKETTGKEVPEVKPVIILANNNVLLENQANLPIYRVSQFIHQMRSEPVVLNEQEMKDIYEWLQQYEAPQKSYEVLNYNVKLKEAYAVLVEVEQQVEVLKQCFAEMLEEVRKDKYLSSQLWIKHKIR